MKLEDQVVNLELAVKLKELEFKQDSLFYWEVVEDEYNEKPKLLYLENRPVDKKGEYRSTHKGEWEEKYYSAYTTAELGEMFLRLESYYLVKCYFNSIKYHISVSSIKNGEWNIITTFRDKTESDARAQMLIYLKENNLLT